jgi:hypothetical protein
MNLGGAMTFADSRTDVLNYSAWPQLEDGEFELEFHLVYQGSLPAQGHGGGKTRTPEKHAMRKVFHRQLATVWQMHPFLNKFIKEDLEGPPSKPRHGYADRYATCGYRFMPLVSEFLMVACSLDIIFLRRDGPGSMIKSGGDIDNRLKVLFDALRMPATSDEVCGNSPAADEDPFYVLLEDDKLISKVQVETNWLLTPPTAHEHINDVHLLIRVKTIVTGSNQYEAAFL